MMDSDWNPLFMLRRLSAILVICVGLLAIGGPAAACALASAKSDCCPEGGQPCGEGGAGSTISPDATACCFIAPTPGVATPVEASLIRAPHHPQAGGADPQLPLLWLLTLRPRDAIPIPISYPASSRVDNASRTYLRTLRLRL
jgi:hypothetical protein